MLYRSRVAVSEDPSVFVKLQAVARHNNSPPVPRLFCPSYIWGENCWEGTLEHKQPFSLPPHLEVTNIQRLKSWSLVKDITYSRGYNELCSTELHLFCFLWWIPASLLLVASRTKLHSGEQHPSYIQSIWGRHCKEEQVEMLGFKNVTWLL